MTFSLSMTSVSDIHLWALSLFDGFFAVFLSELF